MAAILDTFSALPRLLQFGLGSFAVLGVGLVDRLTGPLFSLAIFYLVPVTLTAWLLGRWAGNLQALLAAAVWAVADQLGPVSEPKSAISYWNDVILLAVFLVIVYLVGTLKATWALENEVLADVQGTLLPGEISQVPGCHVAGRWQPAGAVGGDYYDVLPVAGGAVTVCIADVSGKGIPAALMMSNVQAGLRTIVGNGLSPAAAAGRLNSLVSANTRANSFVTLFLGVLDPSRGRLVFCNAGHPAPMLVRRDGSWQRLTRGGPVLGVFPSASYLDEEIELRPGDRIVLYTDGVTERTGSGGEEFGEDRLLQVVRLNRDKDADDLCDAILAETDRFGRGRFEDDLTIVVAAVT